MSQPHIILDQRRFDSIAALFSGLYPHVSGVGFKDRL
jgi:hypothetical protein